MRLIDADDFFEIFPELAIEPYINAPTVERPKGKWIFDQEENVLTQTGEFVATYHCSECGKKIKTVESYLSKNHCFCSVCGARMER